MYVPSVSLNDILKYQRLSLEKCCRTKFLRKLKIMNDKRSDDVLNGSRWYDWSDWMKFTKTPEQIKADQKAFKFLHWLEKEQARIYGKTKN